MVPSTTASLQAPEAAKQSQAITLLPPYFTVGMILFLQCSVSSTPYVERHTPSQKLNVCLVSPQSISSKDLKIIKMFSVKNEMSLHVFFYFFSSAVVFWS